MVISCVVGDCKFEGEAAELVSRMDADTHDPWDQGVFTCPKCGQCHYVNSVKGKVISGAPDEGILIGKECEIIFHDGLVDLAIRYLTGDRNE